jgi:hypothetical protein
MDMLSTATPIQGIVGHGIGINSNLSLSIAAAATDDPLAAANSTLRPADSTLTSLFIQSGAIGVLLFYGLLAWAGQRDKILRPFYIVIALCSLVMIVPELFPVNYLLAFALVHSASIRQAAISGR